jgi:hypothetical protein
MKLVLQHEYQVSRARVAASATVTIVDKIVDRIAL